MESLDLSVALLQIEAPMYCMLRLIYLEHADALRHAGMP